MWSRTKSCSLRLAPPNPSRVYPAKLLGVTKDSPLFNRHAESQSLIPRLTRVELKSVTSADSFQLPLHASTPNHTSPSSSFALPASIANHGLALWLVVKR